MPIIEMAVLGGRCDRCGVQEPLQPDRAETEKTLQELGWEPLSAGLWLCPACVAAVGDPASWAAAALIARRRKRTERH